MVFLEKVLESLHSITDSENIFLNEPMKNHTSFRTGGPAEIMVVPSSKEELLACMKLDISKTMIGNGSNLLVKDGGIKGLVIKTTKLNQIQVKGNIIEAESGAFLARIANVAKDNSLTGFEFASGIPGTLGGAISMNAGAYGSEMKDVVIATEYIDENFQIQTIKLDQHEFSYRKSFFTGTNNVVLSSKIQLEEGNIEDITMKMQELREQRIKKQPLSFPSAGSTFKRPEGYFAGKLIEDAGLKGYRIGGAEVSTLHAGFIVNVENASSKDILELIEYVQKTVKEKFGVCLETEVKIIGED